MRGGGSGRGHRDVVDAGDDRGGLAVVVGVGIDVDGETVVERGWVGIVVRVGRERRSTLLRLGSGLGRLRGLGVKGALSGLRVRCLGLELPFKDAGPILRAFFVELVFPFVFGFFTVLADVTTLVAAGAVAPLDVVVQLTLGFRGNLVAVDDGVEVGTLQATRDPSRLLVGWAARQVGLIGFLGIGRGVRVIACLGVFVGGGLGLIPFLLCGFGFRDIQEVRDGCFDTPEIGWVRTSINGQFNFF